MAYVAFILIGVSAAVGGVLLPAQMADYSIDRTTIGITFFTFSAGFMAAGSTAGVVVDRLGTRAALGCGGGLFTLAALGTAARPPFAVFAAITVVSGYGSGLVESVLNAYLSQLPGATVLLNRLHAFFGVGACRTAAGRVDADVLAVDRRVAGARLNVPLTVACILTTWSGAADGRPLGDAGASVPDGGPLPAADHGAEPTPGGGLLASTVRVPAVMLGAVFLAVYVGLEVSVGNWGFSFMVEERGQRNLLAGYTVSGFWLGLTTGRFLISPIATRIGLTATGMTSACLAGVAAGAALVWLTPWAVVASLGLVLLGFCLGPIFPTAMAVAPRLTAPRLVPTAIGVMNGLSVVGGSALPWLAGAIAQSAGLWTLPPYIVALALVQLAIWRLVVDRMTPARGD
jgi:fucose permease